MQTTQNIQYAGQLKVDAALSRLPVKVKRFSILKAPFKYHKHFEAFQFKTYKRLVTIKDLPFEEEAHMEHIVSQVRRCTRYTAVHAPAVLPVFGRRVSTETAQ